MGDDKRRFVGPGGAVFVPNVPDDTVELKVKAGEWTPVEPTPERKEPAAPKRTRTPKPVE